LADGDFLAGDEGGRDTQPAARQLARERLAGHAQRVVLYDERSDSLPVALFPRQRTSGPM
jgi:hypothetical protein